MSAFFVFDGRPECSKRQWRRQASEQSGLNKTNANAHVNEQ